MRKEGITVADPTPTPGFFSGLGRALYERVIVSYRSTLIGIALAASVLVVDYTTDYLKTLPGGWADALAAVLVIVGGLLRGKQVAAVKAVPPAAALLLVGALAFASPARAQDVPPPPGPMAVQLTPDLSLHLNVAVPAVGYSLTRNQFLGQITFGLAYALDYRGQVAFGLGGGYVQTNDQPGLNVSAMLAGPVLPFELAAGTKLRPALLYEYLWRGADHDNIVAATLALQF